jgi:hypothetical protein
VLADSLDLSPQVRVQVVEGMKRQVDVLAGSGSDVAADVVILCEHPAAGVLDDENLLSPQELLADDE